MKKLLLLLSITATGCTTLTEKDEVGCTCNEIKDKKIVAHEYPTLYWEWKLYVDHCQGSTQWVNVQQGTYNSLNRGDCYP